MLGLSLILAAVAPPMLSAACSRSPAPPTPTASPTSSHGVAPSKAEIIAAVKRIYRHRHLSPLYNISVLRVEQGANGRWRASADLRLSPQSSMWPGIMVIVKDPGGWRFVSLKTYAPDYTPAPPSPFGATFQPL
jgi:hypothetical protein